MKSCTYWCIVAFLFLGSVGVLFGQEVIFSTEGSFTEGDAMGGDGTYLDTYSVRVQEGTTIEVVCYSDVVDTYIEAVLPGGATISNDDYDGFNAGFMYSVAETGMMELAISPLFSDEGGDYRLIIRELGEARRLSAGEVVQGVLGKGSYGPRADRYDFEGRAGQRIVIDLISDDFDAYLQLFDATGQEYTDDDGGGDYNSRLGYLFESDGVVHIVAGSIGGDGVGTYELRISESAQKVAAEYRGELVSSDNRGYDGAIYDVYEYVGSAGDSLGLSLESDDFDVLIYISNPDGSNLGRDDDGGGDSNSYLDVTLPTDGVYKIYVLSFFEGEGAYRLTIFD